MRYLSAGAEAMAAMFADFGMARPYIPVGRPRARAKTPADHDRIHKAILKRARKANELRYLAEIGAIGTA